MKRKIKIWTLRVVISVLVLSGLLFTIILYPTLTYANKTQYANFTIYHNQKLSPNFTSVLDQVNVLLKKSDIYTKNLELDLCLNDGSMYPAIIKTLRGPAFAWGFYNKIVLQGNLHCQNNYVELNGYKWNLVQLVTHESIHCLQFERFGLLNSKPVADIANWKWEGYAEYISRQNESQTNLIKNLERLDQSAENTWEICFSDSTMSPREYYLYWNLVQYCMDVKRMNFSEILKDTLSEKARYSEMIQWYNIQKKKAEL